jgi:hypothetical protein
MTCPRFARAAAIALAAALLCAAPVAFPQWSGSRTQPETGKAQALAEFVAPSATATVLRLAPVDGTRIDAVKRENLRAWKKRLQVGIGRRVDDGAASSAALRWSPVAGGIAARWQVASPGARALRIALTATGAADRVQLRFAGSGAPERIYGPYGVQELAGGDGLAWGPVLEGDTATIELFVPAGGSAADAPLSIARVSHLFADPVDRDVESQAKASALCEVDIACRSSSDPALAQAGKAVARMVFSDGAGGGSFLCSGTLLNARSGSPAPYFYSANHCIGTQAFADTLVTFWFYDATSCGSGTVNPGYVQLAGGATLLFANASSDALLLRLNRTPPAGAVYAGWNAASLTIGAALTAIHHPMGDVKKVSLATMGGFGTTTLATGSFIVANWNSIATGVTEGGSSGSGIFTLESSEYRLRGGLLGGPSSCVAAPADLHDYYSRFDQAYPYLAVYLDPASTSCTYSLSQASVSVAAAGASGSVSVTTQPACPWAATSNADWVAANASGSGSGTIAYTVAPNTDGARSGAILVGGQSLAIAQSAAASDGSNVLANPGFESGTAAWSQSSTAGAALVYNDGVYSHTGAGYGWLGGIPGDTDVLAQDIAIPASASRASLRFWYRISTAESAGAPFDTLTVTVNDPSSGVRLATLATFSNADAGTSWTHSPAYDLTAYKGRTVRLSFTATNDFSNQTSFFLDDLTLDAALPNFTALWWKADESGWGLNVNQQGDIVFATLFDYDSAGNPMWLFMSRGDRQASADTFSGPLYRAHGPAFDAQPFPPIGPSNIEQVGTMTIAFGAADSATLTYSVDGKTVVKPITRNVYGSRAASCTGTTGDRSGLANYQDLWWTAAESGWGLNVTHQDETLFATLFTYDPSGHDLWLFMSGGTKQADGSYLGDLYISSAMSAFDAQPFVPLDAGRNLRKVGTMRLRFSSGTAGTLTYSFDGTTVVKSIVRDEFSSPLPACSS